MARAKQVLQWHNLGGSLWLSGGKEATAGGALTIDTPAGNLRRADGINPIRAASVRSRNGSLVEYSAAPPSGAHTFNAYNIYRFAEQDFAAVGTNFYMNGSVINTGLNGDRLTFAKMPPQTGDPAYLFVAGSGAPFKVDASGNVTNWGIEPPANGLTGALTAQLSKQILTLNGDASNWSMTNGSVANFIGFYPTDFGGTVSSLEFSITGSHTSITGTRALSIDLSKFVTLGDSNDGDLIAFYIATDAAQNVLTIQIDFDLGTNFSTDFYTYEITTSVTQEIPPKPVKQHKGIGSIFSGQDLQLFPRISSPTAQGTPPPQILGGPPSWDPPVGNISGLGNLADPTSIFQIQEQINQTSAPANINAWTRIIIAKNQFTRVGSNGELGWADISAIRLTAQIAQPPADMFFGDMQMIGGGTLQGLYQYYQTFLCAAETTLLTGSRSNPNGQTATTNPQPCEVANAQRQSITVANLQQPTDPQVTRIEIWRTVGNGAYFFKVDDVAVGTTSYVDNVADYFGMNPVFDDWVPDNQYAVGNWITPVLNNPGPLQNGVSVGGYGYVCSVAGTSAAVTEPTWNQTLGDTTTDGTATWITMPVQKVLQDLLISFENTPPESNFNRVAGPWQGSLFWCTGTDGKLYYSPPGMPEAYAAWLDITGGDDWLQMPVVFNGNLYVFSQKACFIIMAVQAPSTIPGLVPSTNLYTYQQLMGIPGTNNPFTIGITDAGLIYQSTSSGFTLFNGSTAQAISDGPLGLLPYGSVNIESYTPFTGVTADWGVAHEYIVSDGVSQSFAFNTLTGSWRSLGVGLNCIYYASDEEQWNATLNNEQVQYEAPGANLDNQISVEGTPIPFQVEVPSQEPQGGTDFISQRIYLEANLGNQTLIPTLIVDGNEVVLPSISGPGPTTNDEARQRYEITTNVSGRLFGVRLNGQITSPIEVFWIEMDVV